MAYTLGGKKYLGWELSNKTLSWQISGGIKMQKAFAERSKKMRKWNKLTHKEKQIHLAAQLKQLLPFEKLPRITCLCGKTCSIMYMYRCMECGVYWCSKCGKLHFKTSSKRKKRKYPQWKQKDEKETEK